jgi:hypothetical protein
MSKQELALCSWQGSNPLVLQVPAEKALGKVAAEKALGKVAANASMCR